MNQEQTADVIDLLKSYWPTKEDLINALIGISVAALDGADEKTFVEFCTRIARLLDLADRVFLDSVTQVDPVL